MRPVSQSTWSRRANCYWRVLYVPFNPLDDWTCLEGTQLSSTGGKDMLRQGNYPDGTIIQVVGGNKAGRYEVYCKTLKPHPKEK